MTGVRCTTGWATRLMRYIARALALIWAGWWAVFVFLFIFYLTGHVVTAGPPRQLGVEFCLMFLLILAPFILVPWASVAIPWRWEAVGGVVLVAEGLFLFIVISLIFELDLVTVTTTAFPPLVAGVLFLAGWWLSKPSRPVTPGEGV